MLFQALVTLTMIVVSFIPEVSWDNNVEAGRERHVWM